VSKVKCGTYPLLYPLPAILVGAMVDGKPNFATLGNCGIVSVDPAVLYISSDRSHHTNQGICQTGFFSVNVPSTGLVERVDYCGLTSGRDTDKAAIFKCFYEINDFIPMIAECPINIACKVTKSIDVYNMTVFIATVIQVLVDERCLTNGVADTKKIDPLIYCMDNQYWTIGNSIGDGFSIGKAYGKQK
jgi:flavin reductase (DIM6/NTAB) family NADH-FMN oxidoreductase RutF